MMELQGEDGCVVELSETLKKELGRGPGIAPHDRSVSRRQVRLQVQQISSHSVVIEVIGPNPICVLHNSVGDLEMEIVKPGTQSSLKIGDKFSLSIQEPVFYTLRRPQLSGYESTDRGKLLKDEEQGVDEEKGIAEAVARWQRRKQERLQSDQRRPLTVEEGAQQAQDGSQQELVYNQAVSQEANEPEQIERPTTNEDHADVAKKFGFIVEGSEFERYGKKGLDTSKWDWQIGRQPGSDDEDEEGSGRLQQNRTAPGPSTKRKAKPRSEDDDDDWRGDSDGEKEFLSTRKRPVPRKKDVQTRSRNLATSSEVIVDPGKKRKMVSTSDMERPSIEERDSKASKQRTASTSTKKTSKRKPPASESEEEKDDDDGEDLDGFLVDDAEEEDEEVGDEEDEWTDEDDAIEDDDELEEDPARAHAPGRPVRDKGDGDGDKPLCKYGNKCFRKNKDHLAQFRH